MLEILKEFLSGSKVFDCPLSVSLNIKALVGAYSPLHTENIFGISSFQIF